MADFHNLMIKPYRDVPEALSKMEANGLWSKELNFRSGQESNQFYYDWFRVLRFIYTLNVYTAKCEMNRQNPAYSIEYHSDLKRDFWGEYPRIVINKLNSNKIMVSTSLVEYNEMKMDVSDVANIKPTSFALQFILQNCLVSLWNYFNPYLDSLSKIDYQLFGNKCAIIAQV